jgi:predicted metal-dependent phosphoesterase TrpH
VIDLHLHSTASDGRSSPEKLVEACAHLGLRTISVSDHDTVAALDRVAGACASAGIEWVPGIEITSMHGDDDVHILGYFIDHRSPELARFLDAQVADRRRRVREMMDRLDELGVRVDADQVFRAEDSLDSRWIGRPLLARALLRAGHVRSTREAFERYLAERRAAWVPRRAPSPATVIELIHDAGGISSLAHPGMLRRDEWIPGMAASGLDAIEVYYTEHSPETTERYRTLADRLGLAMSGGSDFHGHHSVHGTVRPGCVQVPEEALGTLKQRWMARRADSRSPEPLR